MSKKQVLIVTYNFLPFNSPGVHRIKGFLQHLAADRFTATVITAKKPYGDVMDESDPLLNGGVPPDTVIHRVCSLEIERCAESLRRSLGRIIVRKNPAAAPTTISRASDENVSPRQGRCGRFLAACMIPDGKIGWVPFAFFRCLRLCVQVSPDVVFTSSPPNSVQLVGLLLKVTTGKKWVADFRDPFNRAPGAGGLRQRIISFLERSILTHADAVIANTPGMRQRMLERFPGLAPEKVQVITNGFDAVPVAPGGKKPEKCVLTFIGTLYPGMADILFRALAKFSQEERDLAARLLIRIAGTYTDRELRLAGHHGIAHLVDFAGFVPYRETFGLMSRSHYLLVLLEDKAQWRTCIPSKLFTYFIMRRPILALVPPGDAAAIIIRTRTGIVVRPDAVADICDVMRTILTEFPRGGVRSKPDWAEINKYDRRVLTRTLERVFDSVMEPSPGAGADVRCARSVV